MNIIHSELFNDTGEIIFGFSTKSGLERKAPYFFNLSLSVGDDPAIVKVNREAFFNSLNVKNVALQSQIHSDIVKIVHKSGVSGESDAMITSLTGLGLAVSAADCGNIYIFDRRKRVIAAVHSGWKGAMKQIVAKTLHQLAQVFNSKPADLLVYCGPSISQQNYEVGEEVARFFALKFLSISNKKIFLDVSGVNYSMLRDFGIPANNIESSGLCTYERSSFLHSYRADGTASGRALGLIALREA